MKPCSKCGVPMPSDREHFGPDRRAADGLQSQCRDCQRAARRLAYAMDPDTHRARRLAFYYRDNTYDSAYSAAYQAAHRDQKRAYSRASYRRHKEQKMAWRREYRRLHPEMARAEVRCRQARKRGAEGRYGPDDILAQGVAQHGKCYWCQAGLGEKYHVDHVIPIALGGSNWPSNLVVACVACNCSKGAKHPMDFAGVMF